MKRYFIAMAPAVIVGAVASWYWIQLRAEHEALTHTQRTHAKALVPSNAGTPETKMSSAKGAKTPPPMTAELAALLQEIQAQENAIAEASRQADELAAQLPPTGSDEVIASFGKIEDMGRDTGKALQELLRMQTGEDVENVDASFLRLLRVKGRLPEIRAFENNPDEIARFQSSTLTQALNLPPSAETAMQPLIRDAFQGMEAQQLTASHRPADPADAEAWIAKRSQALQQLMLRLRPHLPNSGTPLARQALMFTLNVGAGFEEQQTLTSDKATLSFGVTWPTVPW